MAAVYDVIKDFGAGRGADSVTTSPNWALCVLRLKNPLTYRRSSGSSQSKIYTEAVELRGAPLILTDEVIQLQVQSTKTNYVMSMNATLKEMGLHLMNEVMPGDYVFAWMANNEADFASVLSRLQGVQEVAQACNLFMDGLKFAGKIQSVHKQLQQSPDGLRTLTYTIQGVSFTEFDAQIFYDPHLAERPDIKNDLGTYFGKIGASLNELVRGDNSKPAGIDVNKALPFFIDLLLGRGIPPNLSVSSDERLRSTIGLDAEGSYIVPALFGQLLGKSRVSSNFCRYADILETVIGLQKYGRASNTALAFQPSGTAIDGSRRFTGTDMLGTFLPQTPQFTNRPIWSILQQYLNSAVNEMYTCLRVNPDGHVVPTFVARQLPFSSVLFKDGPEGSLPHTQFMEIPRWGIDPVLVRSVDIGRSDALRFNFIHVYGDALDPLRGITEQLVANPPMRDDLDVARSGLRSFMQTIACLNEDIRNGSPKKWMALLADILMGQHLTMTGIMQTVGIQSPICPGDNIEWDGIVFHIESVTHNCAIDATGKKTFMTSMSLSHGVRADPKTKDSDLHLYAGVLPTDQTGFDPGSSSDTEKPRLVDDAEISNRSSLLGNLGDFLVDPTTTGSRGGAS